MNKDKYRHELKYICSNMELELLRVKLAATMNKDLHANIDGMYSIRSIYFDDLYNTNYYENEAGINVREKWRIRAYNNNRSGIFLECKRKENGMILKTSCQISQEQYASLISGEKIDISETNPKLLNRFMILQRNRNLLPKVIVGYDRSPYICKNGNVRVTFDCNIFSSSDIELFFEDNICRRPILPSGSQLLEVKFDEYLPDYIYRAIQMTNMQQITFSKYFFSKKFSL